MRNGKLGVAILLPLLLAGAAADRRCGDEERIQKIRDLGVYGDAVPVAGGRTGSGREQQGKDTTPLPEPGEGTAQRDERPPAQPSTPNRRCEEQ